MFQNFLKKLYLILYQNNEHISYNNLENVQEIWNVPTVPQPSRQNSLQDVVDVLMRAPILFDENNHSQGLFVPEDDLSDFFEFDHFFDQAIIDEHTPKYFQTSPPVCV